MFFSTWLGVGGWAEIDIWVGTSPMSSFVIQTTHTQQYYYNFAVWSLSHQSLLSFISSSTKRFNFLKLYFLFPRQARCDSHYLALADISLSWPHSQILNCRVISTRVSQAQGARVPSILHTVQPSKAEHLYMVSYPYPLRPPSFLLYGSVHWEVPL